MNRILHFGIGNFHRAHQAWYTHRAGGWKITGVSLRSAGVRDRLAPQDFGYTLVIKDAKGVSHAWIDVIDEVLVGAEDAGRIIERIASPRTHVITFTITEKGYHLDPASGALNADDPAIRADLDGATGTVFGFLARGLAARQAAGAGPVTLVSCDNLSGNGEKLKKALTGFCDIAAPDLAPWLASHVSFPDTMVDRITPATTDALIDEVKQATGRNDASPVATEAFSDWVIQDDFAGPRPSWEEVGARLVDDVAPYELRKLRLLNGAHSWLAYAGTLAGHTHVHEAIADPDLLKGARSVMAEATETLPDEIRAETPAYADALIARFTNPSLHHKLRQIAMDGSQKLPQRLVAPWQARRDAGQAADAIETAIAAWVSFVLSETAAGRALDDPLAEALADACNQDEPVAAILKAAGLPDALAQPVIDKRAEAGNGR
ncbi:mannitol dehydrogenase family protein [Oceaniglobus trochenteri]|uniref:mannitol dehydrogenase family protein n=1 Tax=Oceaniglobus trochenteri TaxID=2763260 RepID=UPI001CFF9962|nr:mannitol dehydrogenase family protein [Oceaniglobus trochenteri]